MTQHAIETKDAARHTPVQGLPPLENKAGTGPVRSAVDDFAHAFAAFKETNDERLRQIEGRLGTDVVTEEKLARIDARPRFRPHPPRPAQPGARPAGARRRQGP